MNERKEDGISIVKWITVERPGYLGKKKDQMYNLWNNKYGEENWRLVNEANNGQIFTYEDIIWKVYTPGYLNYFLENIDEAVWVTDNFGFGYDKDMITKEQGFDLYYLYNKPNVANQFHHVSFNLALEYYLGLTFKGETPLQVREGKPGTPVSEQPKGYLWSPGRILSVRKDLIPKTNFDTVWWEDGSIEHFYQATKSLQIKID